MSMTRREARDHVAYHVSRDSAWVYDYHHEPHFHAAVDQLSAVLPLITQALRAADIPVPPTAQDRWTVSMLEQIHREARDRAAYDKELAVSREQIRRILPDETRRILNQFT